MTSLEPLKLLADKARPLEPEIVPLNKSLGRISVESIRAIYPDPPFSCSRWDGYSIVSDDTRHASPDSPVRLRIIQDRPVTAGMKDRVKIESGYCCAIMSGAPVPDGADAVVKFEDVVVKDNAIELVTPVNSGDGVFPKGSFCGPGEVVLERGTRIKPYDVFRLAEAGFGKVKVFRRPRMALFAVGDELLEPGEDLVEACRYAGVQHFIGSIARLEGIDVMHEEILQDDLNILIEKFRLVSLKQLDIVVTTGGTGKGVKDLVVKAWTQCGGEVVFHGLPLIPGKSTAGGIIGNSLWLALPGGAMGAVVSFMETLRAVGPVWYGGDNPIFPMLEVIAGQSIESHPWRYRAVWGRVESQDGMLIFLPDQGKSGKFWEFEGYVLLEPGFDMVTEGTVCKFVTF
ncbi:MAG: molybdopterin molybdotransferase MoeA [Thermodesulforhabdaceae bacterium]